jgi:hypothetical protein
MDLWDLCLASFSLCLFCDFHFFSSTFVAGPREMMWGLSRKDGEVDFVVLPTLTEGLCNKTLKLQLDLPACRSNPAGAVRDDRNGDDHKQSVPGGKEGRLRGAAAAGGLCQMCTGCTG